MDLLYGLQGSMAGNAEDDLSGVDTSDLPGSIPDVDPSKFPSREELLQLLDGLTGLSEEDKASLREELSKPLEEQLKFAQPDALPFTYQALMLLALLAILALIFGNYDLSLAKLGEK